MKNRAIWQFLLLTTLSLSIGWGVRGQFGHEYGAGMAGALGCLAVALLSGREDWLRRSAYFAMFGGIGWALGGSMSYMKVVAYSHSSDSSTALYGFACMFLLGFIWAAPGGFGCALPAYWDRRKLTDLFYPLTAVIAAWFVRDLVADLYPGLRFEGMGIIAPVVGVLVLGAIRRRFDQGSILVFYMCGGWWAGMLLLVRLAGLHLNPPRADGWAGSLGLVLALLVYCYRYHLGGIAFTTLCTGLLGGIGFALGDAIKQTGIRTGLVTNWHSIMEQTEGALHGLALAVAMALILRRAPRVDDETPARRWTDVYAVVFLLWLFPYLNFRKGPADWLHAVPTLTSRMYGIAVEAYFRPSLGFIGWFDMALLAIGAAMTWLLVIHLRRPVPLVPASWLGKAQLLYLVFLWTQIIIDFAYVLPQFTPIRLVTEWFMTINAAFCTVLAIKGSLAPPRRASELPVSDSSYMPWIRRTVALGLLGAVITVFGCWGWKLALYGDAAVPGATNHIRFGPQNTNDKK